MNNPQSIGGSGAPGDPSGRAPLPVGSAPGGLASRGTTMALRRTGILNGKPAKESKGGKIGGKGLTYPSKLGKGNKTKETLARKAKQLKNKGLKKKGKKL